MKTFHFFILSIVVLSSNLFAADSLHFRHTIETSLHNPPAHGRDFWITLCENYDAGGAGKYYMLYAVSPKKTTIKIQETGSSLQAFPVPAWEVVAFKIPLAWELTS